MDFFNLLGIKPSSINHAVRKKRIKEQVIKDQKNLKKQNDQMNKDLKSIIDESQGKY